MSVIDNSFKSNINKLNNSNYNIQCNKVCTIALKINDINKI